MKRLVIGICLALIGAGASLVAGRAQNTADTAANVPPTYNWAAGNPLKIALLKWYQANVATRFPVGRQPYGLAFDGANIWAGNALDDTVTKLRAADGTVRHIQCWKHSLRRDLRRRGYLGFEQRRWNGHQATGQRR
jgi:hypothetical protein